MLKLCEGKGKRVNVEVQEEMRPPRVFKIGSTNISHGYANLDMATD